MEPWGFEPQIQPCHGRVIPFHYGPGIDKLIVAKSVVGTEPVSSGAGGGRAGGGLQRGGLGAEPRGGGLEGD